MVVRPSDSIPPPIPSPTHPFANPPILRIPLRSRAPRLASFALFGLFLKGIFQFFLYSFWIPKFTQRGGLALGVLVDQGFYVPGMYYPVYFVLTGKVSLRQVLDARRRCCSPFNPREIR